MNFWDFLWLMLSAFFFVAYLLVLFNIIADLFRDSELSGWVKAIWILFLIFLPALTALVYIITRGKGMAERSIASAHAQQRAADSYIRQVAGTSPAEQIATAKQLLDGGVISQPEFEALKTRALAS